MGKQACNFSGGLCGKCGNLLEGVGSGGQQEYYACPKCHKPTPPKQNKGMKEVERILDAFAFMFDGGSSKRSSLKAYIGVLKHTITQLNAHYHKLACGCCDTTVLSDGQRNHIKNRLDKAFKGGGE